MSRKVPVRTPVMTLVKKAASDADCFAGAVAV